MIAGIGVLVVGMVLLFMAFWFDNVMFKLRPTPWFAMPMFILLMCAAVLALSTGFVLLAVAVAVSQEMVRGL